MCDTIKREKKDNGALSLDDFLSSFVHLKVFNIFILKLITFGGGGRSVARGKKKTVGWRPERV
jgi:hypothetical protein